MHYAAYAHGTPKSMETPKFKPLKLFSDYIPAQDARSNTRMNDIVLLANNEGQIKN